MPIVFVVEDEESFIDAMTVGLKREGFQVEVARDGFEALDRFDDVNPSLIDSVHSVNIDVDADDFNLTSSKSSGWLLNQDKSVLAALIGRRAEKTRLLIRWLRILQNVC